jgi:hypothetical protein
MTDVDKARIGHKIENDTLDRPDKVVVESKVGGQGDDGRTSYQSRTSHESLHSAHTSAVVRK